MSCRDGPRLLKMLPAANNDWRWEIIRHLVTRPIDWHCPLIGCLGPNCPLIGWSEKLMRCKHGHYPAGEERTCGWHDHTQCSGHPDPDILASGHPDIQQVHFFLIVPIYQFLIYSLTGWLSKCHLGFIFLCMLQMAYCDTHSRENRGHPKWSCSYQQTLSVQQFAVLQW